MADVDLYSHPEKYELFQSKRQDYVGAIKMAILLALKNAPAKKELVIADFCCGTGSNTKLFSHKNPLRKAILVDINKGFLEIAKESEIHSKEIKALCKNVLNAKFSKEADIVFSIFAYHHIPNSKKYLYLKKVKSVLKKGGVFVLAEIYFPDKKSGKDYYSKLFDSIPKSKRISGLKKFLMQPAASDDFEFKVSKYFAEKQFAKEGFYKKEEVKIWPRNMNSGEDTGTFVQIFSY